MRRCCPLCGWATVALAFTRLPHHVAGERRPAAPLSVGSRERGIRPPAFVLSPSLFSASGGGTLGGKRRRGVGRLNGKRKKGKRSGGNGDDYREAAKALEKMDKIKERKTQDRAKRRDAKLPPAPRVRQDDEQDDYSGVSKAGANPFKKERIVSKFDVNDIRKIEFVGSYVDDESAWPKTTLPEIAFLGRSNVGKSSMLNTLFGEAVAKVSKTPGRTRQINIFKAKNSKGKDVCYFADLPGYGYAKMGKDTQRTIETFLEMYLARRANLKLLILLADSRREPLAADAGVLEYAEDREDRPYQILMVATKVDKLNPMESVLSINRLQAAYHLPPGLPVSYSSVTGQGKKEIWAYIRQAAASG